jgi:hypothetical protein
MKISEKCLRKYKRRIAHGERYVQIKNLLQNKVATDQAALQMFLRLPKKMCREMASCYYSKKLNKVWKGILSGGEAKQCL